MNYPKTILNLIESFKKLPGIGEKTAERLALSTLNMDDDTIEIFSNSLKEVKNKIKKCEKCGSYTEEEICDILKTLSNSKKLEPLMVSITFSVA